MAPEDSLCKTCWTSDYCVDGSLQAERTAGTTMVRKKGNPAVLFSLSFGTSVFSGIQIGGVLNWRENKKKLSREKTIKVEESHNEF